MKQPALGKPYAPSQIFINESIATCKKKFSPYGKDPNSDMHRL